MDFYYQQHNTKNNYWIRGQDSLKIHSKKVVHKTGEFLGNKRAEVVTKSKDAKYVKQEPTEEITFSPEER